MIEESNEEISFEIEKLSNLTFNQDFKSVLKTCLDENYPVLVRCPEQFNIWAIPNDFHENLEIIRLRETENTERHTFNQYNLVRRNIGTPLLRPSLLKRSIILIQLPHSIVENIIEFENSKLLSFYKLYEKNSSGKYRLFESIPCSFHVNAIYEGASSMHKFLNTTCVDHPYTDFRFIFRNYDKKDFDYKDFIELKPCSLDVTFRDCFISQSVAEKLSSMNVESIPSCSTYCVPEGCRHSSQLNDLAVIAHRLFEDRSLPLPPSVKKFLAEELSLNTKEANCSTFFINKRPKGKAKEGMKAPYFQSLIEVCDEFYSDGKLKDVKLNKQKIRHYFERHYGFSDENSRYAAKLIQPD